MDAKRKRLVALFVVVVLLAIALIGEMMRDPKLKEWGDYYFGVAVLGVAVLICLWFIAVALWGASK